MTTGARRLSQALQHLRERAELPPDCQQPEAPADLPLTHGLQLANIESRLTALEKQVTNQNRLLLIGTLAIIGDLASKVIK